MCNEQQTPHDTTAGTVENVLRILWNIGCFIFVLGYYFVVAAVLFCIPFVGWVVGFAWLVYIGPVAMTATFADYYAPLKHSK